MADRPPPRRKPPRGRPPLDPDDSSVKVCVALPSRRYDVLYRRATQARLTIPEFIRQALTRVVDDT
jgi:hypothetical protein